MSIETHNPIQGVYYGTIIFIILGIVAYCILDPIIKKSLSNRSLYLENRGYENIIIKNQY